MSPEAPVPAEESAPPPAPDPVVPIESTVWRLGPGGILITSVVERHAGWLAEQERDAIFFYADLSDSDLVTSDEGTTQKVFQALSSVGLSEGQIINAVNRMQQSGILFRESAV